MINSKMNLNIATNDIPICYRIGRRNDAKPRGIYLKLITDEIKQQIYARKKVLKGTGIIIREDLTKLRVELLNDAIVKLGPKQVRTEFGKIYLNANNKVTMVRSKMDLEKIL